MTAQCPVHTGVSCMAQALHGSGSPPPLRGHRPVVLSTRAAILGAGHMLEEVVAVNSQPAVHRILPLSLTFDHRTVTGGEAGCFLAAVITDLQLPE